MQEINLHFGRNVSVGSAVTSIGVKITTTGLERVKASTRCSSAAKNIEQTCGRYKPEVGAGRWSRRMAVQYIFCELAPFRQRRVERIEVIEQASCPLQALY